MLSSSIWKPFVATLILTHGRIAGDCGATGAVRIARNQRAAISIPAAPAPTDPKFGLHLCRDGEVG